MTPSLYTILRKIQYKAYRDATNTSDRSVSLGVEIYVSDPLEDYMANIREEVDAASQLVP